MAGWIEHLAIGWLMLFFAGGVALLTIGGDALCRGSVHAASLLRIPPVIIGLTVVSIATSMPEMFTSLFGVLRGSHGLAVGNIVGSNIGNIGLILALAALICPLAVRSRLVRKDVPILMAVTAIFIGMAWSGISRLEGALLLTICGGYLYYLYRAAREGPEDLTEQVEDRVRTMKGSVALILVGTLALGVGAEFLVRSSVGIARGIGVPEVLIGVTVVSIGTSLPEFAAAMAAAVRKQVELCAGNIIGSNLINLMLIAGTVACVSSLEVERALFTWELPVLMVLTLILWPFFYTGKIVSRTEGGVLLAIYVAFLGITVWLRTGLTG